MPNVRIIIALLVTVVWIGTITLSSVDRTFHPPPEVQSIELVVVTGLFAVELSRRNGNGNGNGNHHGGKQ